MASRIPLTILLAEDNLVNQKIARLILKRLGYLPDVAANGLEVLEALQRQFYDVILMDIKMPDMDGFTLVEQVRDLMVGRRIFEAYTVHQHWILRSREMIGQRLRWWLQAI